MLNKVIKMVHNRWAGMRWLPLMMMAVVLLVGATGVNADKNPDAVRLREKARHYFLLGSRYDAENNAPVAAEYYKKAYLTDTTYPEAAMQYAFHRIGLPTDTLATATEREKSRRIARKFIDEYPGDFLPVMVYANLMDGASQTDEAIYALEGLRKYHPGNSDLLGVLSSLYIDKFDLDKGMEMQEAYEKIEGESFETFVRKAGMCLALGDTLRAMTVIDAMVDKNPDNPQYLIFKAQMQAYVGQTDSALNTSLAAERLCKPGEGGAVKAQLAQFYENAGDSVNYDVKTYEALLSEDLSFDTKSDLLTSYIQNLLVNSGNHDRGDKLFSVLLGQYPHEPSLRALAARYAASRDEFKHASEEIEYALDLDRTNTEYWEQAMLYAVMDDDYKGAEEIYSRARESLHTVPMRLSLLVGTACTMDDRPAEAIEIFKKCLEDNFPGQNLEAPMDMTTIGQYLTLSNLGEIVSLYQQAGDAYQKLGDQEHAFLSYDNSLKIDSRNPLTLNNYAYFLIEDKANASEENIRKAEEMSAIAIEEAPGNPTYLDTRAWVLFRAGRYKDAKEVQMQAIEAAGEDASDEDTSELYSHLGDILFMNGEPAEAVEAWKKALKGAPDDELLSRKVKHKTFYYE